VKLSENQRQAVYAAIHNQIMDIRVRAKTEDYDTEEWDRALFYLMASAYTAVRKALGDYVPVPSGGGKE